MTLDHVAVGQPHADAHNAERDVINILSAQNPVLMPASPMTDGQLLVWSDTLQRMVAAAPVGASVLASALNNSNTAIPLNVQDYGGSVYTALTGMAITVPPSGGRPVTLEWYGIMNQITAGSGTMWVAVKSGSSDIGLSIHSLPIETGETVSSGEYFDTFRGAVPVGAIASPTTYQLNAMVYRVSSANTPAVNVYPLTTGPLVFRAVAG